MIARLEGLLDEVWDNACILRTSSGVGYEISMPVHTLATLPSRGSDLVLYTFLVVREDAQDLYGFHTWDERQTFALLLSISKVGAKTALAMLSQFRPDDLRQIVLEDDPLALARVSGIGKKTAQQIFLELKYKLNMDTVTSLHSAGEHPAAVYHDALTGLENLGYSEEEAAPLLKGILHEQPDLDVSAALRATLKALAKGK